MKKSKEMQPTGAPPHWNDAQMLERLYGLEAPAGLSEAHLEECSACASRWNELQRRRARLLEASAPAISDERLRAQRTAVFARLEGRRARGFWAFAPAAATALVLVAAIVIQSPAPAPPPAVQTAAVLTQSDRELFNDIASIISEDTPRATETFRGLFDGAAAGEEVQ